MQRASPASAWKVAEALACSPLEAGNVTSDFHSASGTSLTNHLGMPDTASTAPQHMYDLTPPAAGHVASAPCRCRHLLVHTDWLLNWQQALQPSQAAQQSMQLIVQVNRIRHLHIQLTLTKRTMPRLYPAPEYGARCLQVSAMHAHVNPVSQHGSVWQHAWL